MILSVQTSGIPMKIFLTIIVFLFFPLKAFAQTWVFQGKIGDLPVVMELNSNEGKLVGRYAYKKNLVGIHLQGDSFDKLKEAKFPKREHDGEKEKLYTMSCNARFRGRLKKGVYSGTWRLLKNKKELKFKLKVLSDGKDAYEKTINKWMRFQRRRKKDVKDKTHTAKALAYAERTTSVIGYQFSNLEHKKAQKKINAFLRAHHQKSVQESHECIEAGYFDVSPAVGHNMMKGAESFDFRIYENRLIEISFSGSVYCGGAHPSNYYTTHTFDLRTGKKVDLNSLFTMYTSTRDTNTLTPYFLNLLKKYRVEKHNCLDGVMEENEIDDVELNISKKGFISARLIGMGHAAFVCELDSLAFIPLKALRKIARPDAKSYFFDE